MGHSRLIALWVLGVGLLLSLSVTRGAVSAQSPSVLEVGNFSAALAGDALPDGWKPLTFKKIERHTVYKMVKDGDTVAIKATSEASSSGLTREIKINLKEYPVVQWRWKVANILKNGNVSKKEGDDYPARIYITFEYDAGKVSFFKKAQYETVELIYGQYPPLGALTTSGRARRPRARWCPIPLPIRSK